RAAELHFPCADIDDTDDGGYEQRRRIFSGDFLVHQAQERVQWHMLTPRKTLAECFAQRHEQRRRNAFARDVAYKKEKPIFVEHEGLVPIAPYFERGLSDRVESQAGGQPLDGSGKGP